MAVVLKLCPKCQHHFPTRSNLVICSPCRTAARVKAQFAGLTPSQRSHALKLRKFGLSRYQAIREARAS